MQIMLFSILFKQEDRYTLNILINKLNDIIEKHIIEIISNFVDYEIVCCVSDKIYDKENNKKQEEDTIFIYNKLERAIALCGISIINKVYIVDYDELLIKDKDHINLNDKSSNFYFNFNKKEYLNAIYNNMNLYENKLNKELLL